MRYSTEAFNYELPAFPATSGYTAQTSLPWTPFDPPYGNVPEAGPSSGVNTASAPIPSRAEYLPWNEQQNVGRPIPGPSSAVGQVYMNSELPDAYGQVENGMNGFHFGFSSDAPIPTSPWNLQAEDGLPLGLYPKAVAFPQREIYIPEQPYVSYLYVG